MDDASTLSYGGTLNEDMPQLPGFRSNRNAPATRKQTIKYVGQHMFITEHAGPGINDLNASTSATSLRMGSGGSQASNGASASGVSRPLTRPNKVLCFSAYFKEAVHDSGLENNRIRRCELYYYLEDDTMQIVEPKQENSGVPQGNFMKRHRVPKSEEGFFSLEDIDVGISLDIYGRLFHVSGCNSSTRAYLCALRGAEPDSDELPPVDRYETDRRNLMSRETGKDLSVSHNIQKNPMKAFAEASLGNTVDNSGRGGFLKYGTTVLRFYCYWDDSDSLYGDVQMFKLHYFLYDNTVEFLTVQSANSGRDKYPLLLKRAKLPKPDGGGYYHWTDLCVGAGVTAYSRRMVLIDADRATRLFYIREGQGELLPRAEPPVEQSRAAAERVAPAYTGFGSEEDSLTSCTGSLVQKAPQKVSREPGVLRYQAAFQSPLPQDEGRLFVVVYDAAESALMIREPPRRNSGVLGGNFMAKGKVRHPDGALVEASDLFVGARLNLGAHRFVILDADAQSRVATLKYMEARPDRFRYSDLESVTRCYEAGADAAFGSDRNEAIAGLLGDRRALSFADFEKFAAAFSDAPKQAHVTFWRSHAVQGQILADACRF